jgi:nicotinate-nucleotide adenylyltransferase
LSGHRLAGGVPVRLPPVAAGMRIGLFGGSFNPPHEGHRLVTLTALRRLGLDRVWWIVTPGNPLKNNRALPPTAARVNAANRFLRHPRAVATGFEDLIGTRYTLDTLRWLRRRLPGVRLVWIMGADNMAGFHRWQGWREIARMMPMAVIDRPGATLGASSGPAGRALARYRLEESDGPLLAGREAPAWVFLHGRRSGLSSTALREAARS